MGACRLLRKEAVSPFSPWGPCSKKSGTKNKSKRSHRLTCQEILSKSKKDVKIDKKIQRNSYFGARQTGSGVIKLVDHKMVELMGSCLTGGQGKSPQFQIEHIRVYPGDRRTDKYTARVPGMDAVVKKKYAPMPNMYQTITSPSTTETHGSSRPKKM